MPSPPSPPQRWRPVTVQGPRSFGGGRLAPHPVLEAHSGAVGDRGAGELEQSAAVARARRRRANRLAPVSRGLGLLPLPDSRLPAAAPAAVSQPGRRLYQGCCVNRS